jgi:hypothetical protein
LCLGGFKVCVWLVMGVRFSAWVAVLSLYTDPLAGSENVLLEVPAGICRVAYPRLWKPVVRQQASFLTGLLATGVVEEGVVSLAVLFEVVQVTLSCAARLRLYSTVAARTADANRLAATWAVAGSGLILEVKSAGALVQNLDPHAFGASLELVPSAFIPYAVQNLDVTGTVSVGFTFIDRS